MVPRNRVGGLPPGVFGVKRAISGKTVCIWGPVFKVANSREPPPAVFLNRFCICGIFVHDSAIDFFCTKRGFVSIST